MITEVEKKKHNRRFKEPPTYNPKRFKDRLKWQGCWPYVLNAKYGYFALIGDFVGKRRKYNATDEEIIETLIEEGKYFELEINQVDEQYNPKKGEYLIWLKRNIKTGRYHLLRRDIDGQWSHKHPGEMPQKANLKKEKDESGFKNFFFSIKQRSK